MKKLLAFIRFIFFYINSQSQNIGYTTTDIGAEFQWYPAGTITGLHIAFNSNLHNSVNIRLGYTKLTGKIGASIMMKKETAGVEQLVIAITLNLFPISFLWGQERIYGE